MPTRAGTILLIDDDDSVRMALRRVLLAEGHFVLEANHGARALALVRQRHGCLDLVLSDVVMPEMSGTEFATTLAEEFPDLPLILMSAGAPLGLTEVGLKGHTLLMLRKPFCSAQLENLIQVMFKLRAIRLFRNRFQRQISQAM
jgi:CheY-like chemotaxis protein